MENEYLTFKEVQAELDLTRNQLSCKYNDRPYNRHYDPTFPKPIRLSDARNARRIFSKKEIEKWKKTNLDNNL